jgi:endonuclease-3
MTTDSWVGNEGQNNRGWLQNPFSDEIALSENGFCFEGICMSKQPFEIDVVMERVRAAVRPFPKAAMFELFEEGFTSPFELLIACIISIRTYDEVMLPTARRFFARARTPDAVSQLTVTEIDALIRACTFHERKAQQIHALAWRVVEEHGGMLPCDADVLLSFDGVGPKCANLVLGIACDEPHIGVDVHVHRVTNRWGYIQMTTPEKTMAALEAKLPRQYWVEINQLLVPFGKHICTGQQPRCATCPVLALCQQVGVTTRR